MTVEAEINFGGHEKFIFSEFERGTGALEIYSCLDQANKVWCENSKGFSGQNRNLKWFFRPKTGDLKKKVFTEISRNFPAKIGISRSFSGRKLVTSKKKRSLLKFQGIFRPKPKFQVVFLISSPQETLIWASICAPKPQTY